MDPASHPLERLLVGYDASGGANAAAAFALWLGSRTHGEVTVLHASPTPERASSADPLPEAAQEVVAYEREWRRRLEQLHEYAVGDVRITPRLERGRPAGALIAAALETGAGLLLVGTRGPGLVRGALLGSVSAQLLAHAPCSVMVFPEDAPGAPASHLRAVVVGVDGSEPSSRGVAIGQALAAALGARLVLVHAYDPHVAFAGAPTSAARAQFERHGRRILHRARELVSAPLDVVDERVEAGGPRHALPAVCEELAPAVLVVGARGLGGFEELLLGSTARRLAAGSPCPVLVAR